MYCARKCDSACFRERSISSIPLASLSETLVKTKKTRQKDALPATSMSGLLSRRETLNIRQMDSVSSAGKESPNITIGASIHSRSKACQEYRKKFAAAQVFYRARGAGPRFTPSWPTLQTQTPEIRNSMLPRFDADPVGVRAGCAVIFIRSARLRPSDRYNNTIKSSHFPIRIFIPIMSNRGNNRISARKQPKQTRSAELLEAAVQVLESEGA